MGSEMCIRDSKNGLDNEPSVGLTLKFIDLQSDQVMWVASTSRTGWGYQNLSSVGSKAIGDLLSEVRFRRGPANSRLAVKRPEPLPTLPSTPSEPLIGAANPAPEVQSPGLKGKKERLLELRSLYETSPTETTGR